MLSLSPGGTHRERDLVVVDPEGRGSVEEPVDVPEPWPKAGAETPPSPCVSAAFVAKTPTLICVPTAFVAKALPLRCASRAFVAKTLPLCHASTACMAKAHILPVLPWLRHCLCLCFHCLRG